MTSPRYAHDERKRNPACDTFSSDTIYSEPADFEKKPEVKLRNWLKNLHGYS